MKRRIDVALVESRLLESRQKAKLALEKGLVMLNGKNVQKASVEVGPNDVLELIALPLQFVSQGGDKLAKALRHFSIDFHAKTVLDVGASTGGFTDCALQNGADRVVAVDVGKGQMHPSLTVNPKLTWYEETNIRDLTDEMMLGKQADFAVVDVSFVSLTQVLIHILPHIKSDGAILALIKPQFEMEQRQSFRNGIIKDEQTRRRALEKIMVYAETIGLNAKSMVETDVDDPKQKNIEYMVWLERVGG